jgi:hypothetical protein
MKFVCIMSSQFVQDIHSIKEAAATHFRSTKNQSKVHCGRYLCTLLESSVISVINISVIPGKTICPTCRKERTSRLKVASDKKDEQCEDKLDSHTENESDGEAMSCWSNQETTLRHDLDT